MQSEGRRLWDKGDEVPFANFMGTRPKPQERRTRNCHVRAMKTPCLGEVTLKTPNFKQFEDPSLVLEAAKTLSLRNRLKALDLELKDLKMRLKFERS